MPADQNGPNATSWPTPLPALIGFALAGLGMGPREAWSATPRELAIAADWLTVGADRPDRAALRGLMARFPDRTDDQTREP